MQQGDTRQGVVETGGGCDTVAHECGWGRAQRVSPWYRRGGAFGGAEYRARVGRDIARRRAQLELLLLPTAARSKPLPDDALSIGRKKRAVQRHSHLPRTILVTGTCQKKKSKKKSLTSPAWVGSRSPDGWDQIPRWAGGWVCTSHPGVLGSIPKREESRKTGLHPVLKYRVPHGSQVGLVVAKPLALRINLNIQGCSVVAPPLHAPSRAPLFLPLLLSHNIPLPRVH